MHTTQFDSKKFLTQVTAVLMIVMLLLTAMPATSVFAATSILLPWAKAYDQATGTGAGVTRVIPAGANRVLVVGIATTSAASGTVGNPTIITYGGQTLTLATGNGATNGRMHTWLYYLKDNAVMDNTARPLNVTMGAGTILNMTVWSAVYAGVDQTPATYTTGNNLNNGGGSGPAALSAAMTVNAGEQAVYISSVYNDTNVTLPTYTINANWTTGGNNTGTSAGTPAAWRNEVANRAVPVANTTDASATSAIAPAGTIRYAMSAMSLPPLPVPTTTVGDGNTPANKTVGGSFTNQAASAFTLSTNLGVDTVTDLVVTGGGTGVANVAASGVKIYRDNGTTANEWDAGDTLVGTTSFAGTTATFTGLSLPVTTVAAQYIITYDIIAAPTNGQTITAVVSGVTATNVVTNNDTTDATLTIDSVAPTVTNVNSPTAAGTYTVGDTILVRITFSENVLVTGTPQITLETGVTDRTINYTGGSGTNQLTFTYTVQAGDTSADLDYVANSLALNGGTIRDAALNNAILTLPAPGAAGSLSANEALVIDTIAPTVTINQAAGQTDPANGQPINFTVVFSEAINNFTAADITLGGTAGTTASGVFTGVNINITNTGANTYNIAISNLVIPGTVIATVNANGVTDNAGNNNTASTSTDNTVTINGYTVAYSVGTGTNGGTGTIGATGYPTAPPTNTINVVAGASRLFNSTPATGSLLSSVLVDGFAVGTFNDYTINNVTSNRTIAAAFDGGWTAPTIATNNGCGNDVVNAYTSNNSFTTCSTGQSGVYSGFGLNIPAGSTINYVEIGIEGHTDSTNLAVSMSENGGANFGNTINTSLAAEPASPDKTFRIGNRPGDDWGIPFSPASFSNANFRLQITGIDGSGGGGGGGGATFSLDQIQVKVNYTLPPVTINQAVGQVDPTNTSPINFTVVFPYPVTDFATGDVTLAGTAGATTATVTGSGTTYNVAVSGMTGDGTVIASIAAGVAHDANGTPNTASTSTDHTVTYNISPPTATIDLQDTSDSGISFTDNITNVASPVFDVTFNEDLLSAPISGNFSNAGTATGCTFTVGALTGNTYPVTVSSCSEGTLILQLAAGAVTDTSTNPIAQTDGPTVTIDRTSPDVTIDQAVAQVDPTGASPINFTAVFTESVFGFTGLDVTLSGTANPTVANVTGGPATYNVAVSNMTTSGPGLTVIANLGAGIAMDAAGNPNTASTSTDNSVVYNSNAPIVSVNLQSASDSGISNVDNITNVASPVFDVNFDEAVSGLTNADFSNVGSATGCTFAVGAPAGNNYPVTVSGCSNGTLIVQLVAGGVQNGTLVPNAQTSGPTVTIDRTAPTVTVNQAVGQPDPTNVLPISFTAVFNETVYNFTSGDVTLVAPVGATATLIGAGPTYGVDVSGLTADGTVTASIGAGVATDAAGNNNAASTSTDNQVTYDTTAPTVTINQAAAQVDPTNASPINFTVIFSEPVIGFATGDVTLNGTAGATTATVTGSGTTYNVAVSGMTGSGTVIANIVAGVATDPAGNDNIVSTSTDNTVTYDVTKPTVTIDQAVGQADPTNVSPIHFTVEFSKSVTGFTSADVTLSSGTATVAGSGTLYDVSVAGMAQGPLTASIPAGAAIDAVGNTSTASTSADNVVVYDTIAPTVTINQAVGQADPTNVSPIHFTVVFSEPVNGFTGAGVVLSSGTATVTGSGALYDVSVAGMAQGILTATIPASAATDDVGLANVASTSTDNSVLYDTVLPTVTVNQEASQADPTNASPINFTVVFSEPVTGFTSADLVATGTAAPTTAVVTSGSGTTYNVTVSGMAADGTVILTVPAGGAQDATGNSNTASTSTDNVVTYDTTRPTVTINQAAGQNDPTNASPINFTVVFSEPVTGFTSADINLTGTAGPTTAVVTGSGATYNVAVSGMTGNGTVTAFVLVNAGQDAANNSSFASTSADNTVTYDITVPTVTINQDPSQADPTGTSPINFAVVFSETINSATFTSGDVVISGTAGATTAVVTGSGTTYNVAISGMTGSGTVIATIPAGGIQDLAGNSNVASVSVDNTVTYDATAPTVTINQAAAQVDPTNGSPINYTVVFSEAVTDFTSADVTLTGTANPTIAVVTGGGNTYNVAVSGMAGSGTVIVTIPANGATDVSGNGNTASTSTDNTVTYDITAPTVTINQAAAQADPTGASPINFTVIFSETVTGFTNADVTMTGTAGAATAVVTGGGTTYNVAVSGMTGPGTVIVSVNAGGAADAAGNANLASTSTDNTVTYDNGALSVTINQAVAQTDPTNVGPINFAVVFSKSVTGFTNADVVLSASTAPGALTAVVTGSGATYSVAVSGMTGSGTVIATIPAGAAQDAALNGNTNSTSTDNTVTYDVTAPTVTINQAIAQVDPTNASPINFTVVFSEPVIGFTAADITLSGTAGATTAVVSGAGPTYNVAVSGMSTSGTVIVSIPASAVTDVAGNNNTASTSTDNTVTFDNSALTVTINQAAAQADPTNALTINFTVVFSKSVTGFTNADVSLSGTAGATNAVVTGVGATYNVAVSGMVGSGTVIATIPAGIAQDASSNLNAASTSTDNTVTYDNTAPTVTINQAALQIDPTNASPINFTVIFSESVTGFTGADVALTGTAGATTAVVTGSGATYNVAVSGMTGSGTVIATVGAGNAQDTAGNGNANSTSTDNTVTYDVTVPTVTINQAIAQVDPTNASPINFTVVFSEPVIGFTGTDVNLAGTAGATTVAVTGTGPTYNVAISGMTISGTVIVSIPASAVTDVAGNNNTASTSTDNTVTYDNAIPSVTINQAAAQVDPTNASPINFTVIFSKPVTGFIGTDVALSGTAGATNAVVTGVGTTYNVAVSGMVGSGTVVATIPAGVAVDASNNANIASASADNSVLYDVTVPTVTINRAVGQADPTNTSPINFAVIFSESVTGFTGADVALSGTAGATTAVVTGTGATYNVAVSGMTGSGTVIATVAAGNAQDAAGNSNTNSTSTDNNVLYDVTVPTVTINQAVAQADPTNASPITFDVIFSKPVVGFTSVDVALSGTAGATTAIVTGSGTTYTVAVSGMTSDGTVIATILAGVATDAVGNPNTASSSTDNTVLYGLTSPTVTINQAAGQADPTNTSPINFTVVFSKPVTGFINTDVALSGTAGATTAVVTGSGATYNIAVSGMTGSGTVIATIPASAAQDTTGNGNTPSTSIDNTVLYDAIAPTVTINQAAGQADPTNASPINFTVVFSEPVTGFTGADVALSGSAGATTAVVTGSGTTYTVAVSGMTGSGTVIAAIPAGNAQDIAGNGNANSTSVDNNVSFDFTAPAVTINQAVGQVDPTNVSPISFEVIFTKSVTGFTGADVTLSGTAGATTAVVTGSGTTYNVAVSGMTSDGTVIASIPAGAATDAVGNPNTISTSTDNTVTYDTTGPTVTINQAAGQLDPTSAATINFTVVFNESVTGFTSADINLGGTAGATTVVVAGSGTTYNVAASGMIGSGTVVVSITDAAAVDAAGNLSAASTSTDNTVTYDTGAPGVTINQAAGQVDPTNLSSINFTVVFTKPVTGFTNADLVLTGTAGATTAVVSGTGANYNVVVSGMAGSGTVIATIPAGRAQDSAANGNTASTSIDNTVLYDVTAPTVTINQAAGQTDPTNTSTINFTVVFSEPVLGFTNADVTLGGTAGPTNAVVTGSGSTYNVAVTGMVTDGTVTATIGAGVATDITGNPNTAGTSTDNEVSYNTTKPTVTVEQAVGQADPTGTSPINFTVVFSELVNGFTDTDLVIGGTAGANLAVISGTGPTYTVAVSGMTNDGTVTLSIPAGAVTDPSNNGNSASTSSDNTVEYLDGTGPHVETVNTNPATPDQILTNAEVVTFNITELKVKFNQDVYNPAGDTDPKDVTNPSNYILVKDLGDTAGVQTLTCATGAAVPADTNIPIGTVTYDSTTHIATFTINSGQPLVNGNYHLFVCGTTSIVDPLNNALALVGSSGLPGTDFRTTFTVNVTNSGGGGGGGGNGGGGNGGNNNNTSQLTNGLLIPVTGFKQGAVTLLPQQPADKAYASTDVWLEIPKLGVKLSIVGVPQTKTGWDISWLGKNAGWLNGSAFPTWKGNSVITAHVWDAQNKPGPFVGLINLTYGDQVKVHAFGQVYTYEIAGSSVIQPSDISTVFQHEDKSWLTLVTCENYQQTTGIYSNRRIVRAVLMTVSKEK